MSTGRTGVGSSLKICGKCEYVLCERVNESSRTHYALDQGPGVAPGLSDDLALLLRVAHTTVVLRGGEGALASGAETNLVEPFGSVAFSYPHPPVVPGIQTVLESAPGYFSWYLLPHRHFPTAKYSLHEPQFTQIWPFQPQKKQNEYAQWDYIFEETSKIFKGVLRGGQSFRKFAMWGI
ncbi:hypothetical protein EDD16DRAFT_1727330 [Pisolithus croceorrhizus]|nr:hypothetical protein EDD16DRAFT_1727330 [Pisolithus croceorrhizus]